MFFPRNEREFHWNRTSLFPVISKIPEKRPPRDMRRVQSNRGRDVVSWDVPGSNDQGRDPQKLNHRFAKGADFETAVHYGHGVVQGQGVEALHAGHLHHPIHQNVPEIQNHNTLRFKQSTQQVVPFRTAKILFLLCVLDLQNIHLHLPFSFILNATVTVA